MEVVAELAGVAGPRPQPVAGAATVTLDDALLPRVDGPRRTVLRTLRADGPALAVRRTGTLSSPAARVHLVGTAAGPMGGDVVEVRVRVGPGAHLDVQAVAASVVLPGRDRALSQLLLDVEVAEGGRLACTLPSVVVTGAAEHDATTRVRLLGDGQLRLVEHVRLGRHGEPGGRWRGHLDVTRDGSPVLRQSTTLGDDPGMRDLRTVLDTAANGPASATHDTVVMPLAVGGTLTVALGATRLLPCPPTLGRAGVNLPG